jgi:hypothetical protein
MALSAAAHVPAQVALALVFAGVLLRSGLRSLPCHLAFCLVIVVAAPSVGLAATALGLLACLAAARATWRIVPVACASG